MTRPRLTFVDHSYHEQTGSNRFLRDLLAKEFDVTTVWDESWRPGAQPLLAKTINATRPQYVVLFQNLPGRAEYARIQCPNVTWFPMHDGVVYGSDWRAWRNSGMKVFCFCAEDSAYFAGIGLPALHLQYAPAPDILVPADAALSVFFWMRHEAVGWDTLKKVLGTHRPERIILRLAPDPGHAPRLPSEEDCRAYSIEIHHGWMEESRYRRLLAGCSVFMAPRPKEGIGQALLEARAMGLAAIAPDAPAMKEYMEHGATGYLYNPRDPAPLDLSDLNGVRQRSVIDLGVRHERWRAAQAELLAFVRRPMRPAYWWRVIARLKRS
jgi:hypothetical protein